MDIRQKQDRIALKSYFAKNAMPTAGNFADLIEGMLSQKDDGIAKPAGEPLSVQADGDNTSQKKVINFYRNFADPAPAWTLSLNPRTDPNNPASAKAGLSFGNAAGASRLFIDETHGNVGIGTAAPTHRFHVVAQDAVGLLESTGTQAYLRLSTKEGLDNRVEVANRPGGRLTLWTAGGGDQFHVTRDGKVGIGIQEPLGKLEVVGAVCISNGTRASIASNMASGSLTIGSTVASYGGGNNWNANTAGLMLETQTNTEIAVHDSYTRLASLLYYEGDAANRITIGRDMGWGPISQVVMNGAVHAGNSDLYFTKTDHKHTGFGNAAGYAAIENAENYDALMILGRAGTKVGRRVELWDYLGVNGKLKVNSGATISGVVIGSEAPEGSGVNVSAWPYESIGLANKGWNLRLCSPNHIFFHTNNSNSNPTAGVADGNWWRPSDARLKKDIGPIERALEKILRLRGVSFAWREPRAGAAERQMGMVAQEVEQVFPEWVSAAPGEDGAKGIAFAGLEALIVEALRELSAKCETLQAELARLQGKPQTQE